MCCGNKAAQRRFDRGRSGLRMIDDLNLAHETYHRTIPLLDCANTGITRHTLHEERT